MTAGERLAQLRVELAQLDEQIDQAELERRLTIMGEGIAYGQVPIGNEMLLVGFVDRLAQKHRWLFRHGLLISDGWSVEDGGSLRGCAHFPGNPKRPPPVVPTSPADGGGSGGGSGGGGAVEITLEESAAVRLEKMAEIAYFEGLANRKEWERRQPMRAWLLQDPVLRAELVPCVTGYTEWEDRKVREAERKEREAKERKERDAGGGG